MQFLHKSRHFNAKGEGILIAMKEFCDLMRTLSPPSKYWHAMAAKFLLGFFSSLIVCHWGRRRKRERHASTAPVVRLAEHVQRNCTCCNLPVAEGKGTSVQAQALVSALQQVCS